MTATPTPRDLDQEWREHLIHASAVKEVAETLDAAMQECSRAAKAYRLHKRRTTTPEECDFGTLAELIIELEKTVREG